MVASIVPEDTPRLRGGSKDKTFFSEINHVEDQNGVYLHELLTLSYYQGSILCTLPTQYAPNIIILLR